MDDQTANNLIPNIPEPTEAEVAEQVAQVATEHGIHLTGDTAIRYTKLTRELGWWLTLDALVADSGSLTDEKARTMQQLVFGLTGTTVTVDEAREQLRTISAVASKREKERIAGEIRGIINSQQ